MITKAIIYHIGGFYEIEFDQIHHQYNNYGQFRELYLGGKLIAILGHNDHIKVIE